MTTTTQKLLNLRRSAKKRKPYFIVKESIFTAGVKKRWRLPRGRHSAARQRHGGRPAQPHPGYGSPRVVWGLDRSGLEPILVYNEQQLQRIDPAIQGAVIGSCVGKKKRVLLLRAAQEKKIPLLCVKDALKAVEDITQQMVARREERKNQRQLKNKKQEEKKKKSEEKEKEEQKKAVSKQESGVESTVSTDGLMAVVESEKEELRKVAEKTITKRQ